MAERALPPVAPKEGERRRLQLLTEALTASPDAAPHLVGADEQVIEIPASVYEALRQVVDAMSRGLAVVVVPVDRELTTQQAADLLNVSRQYLVQLLDQGRLPHHKTGTHRRIHAADLLAFKEARDRRRRTGLRRLTRLSEEFGMYDDDFPTQAAHE